jgi:hypothetical protein
MGIKPAVKVIKPGNHSHWGAVPKPIQPDCIFTAAPLGDMKPWNPPFGRKIGLPLALKYGGILDLLDLSTYDLHFSGFPTLLVRWTPTDQIRKMGRHPLPQLASWLTSDPLVIKHGSGHPLFVEGFFPLKPPILVDFLIFTQIFLCFSHVSLLPEWFFAFVPCPTRLVYRGVSGGAEGARDLDFSGKIPWNPPIDQGKPMMHGKYGNIQWSG